MSALNNIVILIVVFNCLDFLNCDFFISSPEDYMFIDEDIQSLEKIRVARQAPQNGCQNNPGRTANGNNGFQMNNNRRGGNGQMTNRMSNPMVGQNGRTSNTGMGNMGGNSGRGPMAQNNLNKQKGRQQSNGPINRINSPQINQNNRGMSRVPGQNNMQSQNDQSRYQQNRMTG